MGSAGLIYGLGQCCLDHIGLIRHYPEPDGKCELEGLVIQGGGPTATALAALARWGRRCHLASVIGDDRFGEEILRSLEEEGIDTAGVIKRPGTSSQAAFIAAEPASQRRTVFWQRPTGEPLKEGDLDLAVLNEAGLIHTDGLFIEAALFAGRRAKERGIPVVVDAGSLRPGMVELARVSDYFIAAENFARQFAGGDVFAACRLIAELGPEVAAVTRGKEGYVAFHRGRFIEKPAYPAQAVDTTGCGDVFHAGFIYGITAGWGVEASLDLGAWAAAEVSTRVGGRSGIPSRAALLARGMA